MSKKHWDTKTTLRVLATRKYRHIAKQRIKNQIITKIKHREPKLKFSVLKPHEPPGLSSFNEIIKKNYDNP